MHGALLAMRNDDKALAVCLCAALALVAWAPRLARAEEAAPRLLSEPFEYTDVADAFDGDDPFDLNVYLGFEHSVTNGTIEREASGTGTPQAGDRYVPVADSSTSTSALVLGFDAGIYRDLMVYARMPLVLSETHSLTLPSSATCAGCAGVDALLRDVPVGTAGGSNLLLALDPSFESATRSGVPHVDVGIAWGVTNQYRQPALPTWVISFESRLPIGRVMTPCAADGGCDPGISRGTTRLKLESRFSYRIRYFEPYLGVSHAIDWASTAHAQFTPGGDLPGYVDPQPPSTSEATLGIVIVPWEERGRSQRFAIDVRGNAAYVSSGRDYTPLFDALGTSESSHLRAPSSDEITTTPSLRRTLVPFYGLTQVDAHAKLGIQAAAVIQAAQYVRFRLGGGIAHSTTHLLTNAEVCNPDSTARSGDVRSGPCAPQLWNPLYRPVIDLPGQRFRYTSDWTFNLVAAAVGQF